MDTTTGDSGAISLPERPVTDLARAGSRAVVVGTGTHAAGSMLPDIPAVAATATAVRDVLRDQCGMDERHITSVTNPGTLASFLDAVNQATAEAEDVLLLYYIGHGLVSLGSDLFLATAATTGREVMLPAEALPFAAVRDVLSGSPARYVVVVLDCCFSGRAPGTFGTAAANAFELTNVRGSCLLSATSPNEQALAPEGERYTAFSGALLDFLRDGSPAAPRELTLEDAYRHLERALPVHGAPVPQRRVGGDAGGLVVAVNPQAPPVTRPRPDPSERMEVPGSALRPCPYPGLDAFTAADSEYFYGRERLVGEILRVLAADGHGGPLVVVGRSGAGKSSLLQAGLLPAIKAGGLDVPGSRHWPQLVMTPGKHPLRALARRLAAGTGQDAAPVAAALAADPGALVRTVATAPRDSRAPDGLIVCVDQFEEVFTACTDETERRAFVQTLRAATAGDGTPRVQLILGLRADFYSHCLEHPELAAVLDTGQVLVHPMSREELRSAIEDPAVATGLRLEEGLTGRLLRDLESAEGPGRNADTALPLLAFTLQATWQRSDKRVLTLSDYEATGGIWGAVTQRAEKVYEDLGDARDEARFLLLSMIQLGDGTDDVRRRVSVEDLVAGRPDDEREAIRKALDAYVGARLVTVDDGTAEIAHEALLRAWDRLWRWIGEDRQELLGHQRLAEAARVWKQNGGPLYTGARLDDARQWLAGERRPDAEHGVSGRSLGSLERDFVRASARAARRRRSRRWSFAMAAVVALMVLVAGGVYAVRQRAGNEASQAVESSVQLAQEADNLRATDPAGAMWLSLTAYNSSPTPQARTALYNSYRTPYPLVLPERGKGAVVTAAYSPDGRTAAAAWSDGSIRLWNVSDPQHPRLLATVEAGRGGELAYSPDGKLLAVRTPRSLQLWRVASGLFLVSSTPVQASAPRSGAPQSLGQRWPVAFSPGGNTVATGGDDGRVALWNASDPRHPVLAASLPTFGTAINAVTFSPDGKTLAVADGTRVRLWDTHDPGRPAPRAILPARSALSVAFSPDGRLLVAGGSHEQVSIWDAAHPGRAASPPVGFDSNSTSKDIDSVAFRPGGDTFVTTDTAGQTEIWASDGSPKGTDAVAGTIPDLALPDAAAFSPDGGQLVTGDLGGTADIWVLPAPLLSGMLDTGFLNGNESLLNQNDTLLVTDSLNGGAPFEVWDVADPSRPALATVLPGDWDSAGFLPGGRTLYTADSVSGVMRLWDTADPRHPKAEGTVRAGSGWTAGNGWLLVLNGANSSVELWDIRNIGRPVLDATFGPARQLSESRGPEPPALLSGNLALVADGTSVRLWSLSNPRHPIREGAIPVGPNAVWTYQPSNHVFVVMGDSGAGAALWNLGNPRNPVKWGKSTIGVDPSTGEWLDDHTLAGFTNQYNALDLWDVRHPAKPTAHAVLPLDSGVTDAGNLQASSSGRLLAAGVAFSSQITYDNVDVWQSTADHQSLFGYAVIIGDSGNYSLASNGSFLVTNVNTNIYDGVEGELNAFAAHSAYGVGIIYPLDTEAVYRRLCSIALQDHVNSAWRSYVPDTYYRPACS
jgi:WD40 repeat protein